ncbi:hypothetical protein HF325_002250 [Metschnikowia pulcherrima]|uniref:Uncharacterized protein n=1 Tax=Metschnikowia pulcherrima TaxID=27326 RepID=A0A8H7GSN1_9ASCO|nr:hypothetical protein HF325_002250 [Metschnikowia pulcherrima]
MLSISYPLFNRPSIIVRIAKLGIALSDGSAAWIPASVRLIEDDHVRYCAQPGMFKRTLAAFG